MTLISDERMKENTSLGASVGGSKETTPPSCGDALLTLSANLPALMFHIDEDKVSEPCFPLSGGGGGERETALHKDWHGHVINVWYTIITHTHTHTHTFEQIS